MRANGRGGEPPGAITRGRGVEAIEAGAMAGAIGGIAMVAFLCAWAVATGRDVLLPLQLVGGAFYGGRAVAAGFTSALWGLVLHLGVASGLGVVFTLALGRGVDPMAATAAGIVYGLLVWLLLTYLVAPVLDPFLRRTVAEMPIAWFAAHVPFGGALALGEQVRDALDARERAPSEA